MRFRVLALAVAGVTLVACQGSTDAPPVSTWSAVILAESGSGVSGASLVTSDLTGAGATISIAGGASGQLHPWHVHSGGCGGGGAVFGGVAAYSPLQVGASGTASQSAALHVMLLSGQPYHVSVHASPSDLARVIGCGNLVLR